MTLTIILPVHNALVFVKQTIDSLVKNTESDYELIIIDDHSEQETNQYIKSLAIPSTPVVKVVNDFQRWVNYNWNHGVTRARGKYTAIINSDIQFSKGWDTGLIKTLNEGADIACPWEKNDAFGIAYGANSGQVKNLRGACFMFKKDDRAKFFPIPPTLVHWCGDLWIANKAEKIWYPPESVIYHALAKSGDGVEKMLFWYVVRGDLLEYERLTGVKLQEIDYVNHNLGISPHFG